MYMNMNQSDPDTVYFNMRITGNSNNGIFTGDRNNFSSIASYQPISQTNPIVNDPSKYYIAVTDFSCPGESIPIGIARIVPNQGNANLMESIIAFTVEDKPNNTITKFQKQLVFVPSTNTPVPIQNKPYQVITPYYYMYSYEPLITSLNTALNGAFNDMAAVFNVFVPDKKPYFYISYEKDFPKINLMINHDLLIHMFSVNKVTTLSINSYLANYLGGFNYFYNGNSNSNYLDFSFIIPEYNIATTGPSVYFPIVTNASGTPYNYVTETPPNDVTVWYKFTQQNYLLPQWNCLSKIIIYTQSLPIRNQQVTSKLTDSPDVLNKYPILFSFTPNYETSSQARNYIYYTPKENYTLTELLSTSPLTRIDAYVAWVDHNGEVFPLYLNPFQSCNIQFGFFKKELYKSIK